MAKRLQFRRALRMNRTIQNGPPRVFRCAVASLPKAPESPAARHARGDVDGIGAPNETVTGYGISLRPFPEKLAALEAENAAPQAVEVHRNHGHIQAFDNLLHSALERQHVAGPADGAFGEDADHMAVRRVPAARRGSIPRCRGGCPCPPGSPWSCGKPS